MSATGWHAVMLCLRLSSVLKMKNMCADAFPREGSSTAYPVVAITEATADVGTPLLHLFQHSWPVWIWIGAAFLCAAASGVVYSRREQEPQSKLRHLLVHQRFVFPGRCCAHVKCCWHRRVWISAGVCAVAVVLCVCGGVAWALQYGMCLSAQPASESSPLDRFVVTEDAVMVQCAGRASGMVCMLSCLLLLLPPFCVSVCVCV